MAATEPLPDFVPPMLARLGAPFDSEDHFFEIKWDGMRAMAYVSPEREGGMRLINRQRRDVTPRFPEFEHLQALPAGTLLDGELVALVDGVPNFRRLMSRENTRDPATTRGLVSQIPVIYVAFDVLYVEGESVMDQPLSDRRPLLGRIVEACEGHNVLFSEGVPGGGGAGLSFFEQAGDRELEGVVAKRLDSRYLPGQRTDAWTKIKKSHHVHCLILGYVPDDNPRSNDFKSLIIAGPDEAGELSCLGRVGSGLSAEVRKKLLARMNERVRSEPLVPTTDAGVWIDPGLYCTVTFLERTSHGALRAPVFVGLVE